MIAFAFGSIYMIYLLKNKFLKDRPDAIIVVSIFTIFYIFIGVFHCFKSVKLLFNIRKFLNSKKAMDDTTESKLKIEFKAAVFGLIPYLISIPCCIAVLRHFIAISKSV